MNTAAPTPVQRGQHPLKVVDLYKAAIGPLAQDRYLKAFARQENAPGFQWSWHWPAFFSALNWLILRRMWRWLLAYALLAVGLAAALAALGWWGADAQGDPEALWWSLSALYVLAMSALPAVSAHGLFYRHCMGLIQGVLLDGCDRETAHQRLAAQAATRSRALGLWMVNGAAIILLVAWWVFRPTDPVSQVQPSMGQVPEMQAPQPPVPQADTLTVVPPSEGPPPSQQPVPAPIPVAVPAADGRPPVSEVWWSVQGGLPSPEVPAPVPAEPAPAEPAPVQPAASAPAPQKSSPAQAPAPTSAAARAPRAFALQVGMFADPANAGQLLRRLRSAGLVAYAEPVDSGPKMGLTRVRVGPFATAAEAERAAARVRALGLPAVPVKP